MTPLSSESRVREHLADVGSRSFVPALRTPSTMGCGSSKSEQPHPTLGEPPGRRHGVEETSGPPSSAGRNPVVSPGSEPRGPTSPVTSAEGTTQEGEAVADTRKDKQADGLNPMADAKSKIQARNIASQGFGPDHETDNPPHEETEPTQDSETPCEDQDAARPSMDDTLSKEHHHGDSDGSDSSHSAERQILEKKAKKKKKKKKKKKANKGKDIHEEAGDNKEERMDTEASNETPKEQFFRLLNLDTWDKGSFDNSSVLALIEANPDFCSNQYKFDDMHCNVYPLSMLCSLRAQLTTVQACYEAFPPALDETDNFVGTPLHYACTHRAPFQVVSFLVDKQPAHVQAKNPAERTPLHVACMAKAPLETVRLLVEQYPEAVERSDHDGSLPLHLACDKEAPIDVLNYLIHTFPAACHVKNHEGYIPLHLAVKARLSLAAVQALVLASPESVETPDPVGNLPLHLTLVIHRINTEFAIIDYLCRKYPEGKQHRNDRGQTPYDLAQLSLKRDTQVHELLRSE